MKFQFRYSRKLPVLLLLSILLFTAHASSNQLALTDTDKKEILSLLFEQEVSAPKEERIILMSPRTDKTWLLDLPGVRFRQLSYEDEKQASEYYELSDVKVQRDYVEVSFGKGNYCKKTAKGYQFRKDNGKWKAKISRLGESYTAPGTACVGCATGSGSVYTVKSAAARSTEPPKELLLTGKVLATSCKRSNTKHIVCEIELSLDFINQGNQPLIILQPHDDYEFWQGARTLALTKADAEVFHLVYNNAAWPSFYNTDEYRRLAERLDQPAPPANVTRIIPAGERWNWKTTIQLGLDEENTCHGLIGVQVGWNAIKKLSAPLWLQVSYEMWPFNVEHFRKDLGGRLKERWKKHGTLYLEGKLDRFWTAHLRSEPIELDFQHVQLN